MNDLILILQLYHLFIYLYTVRTVHRPTGFTDKPQVIKIKPSTSPSSVTLLRHAEQERDAIITIA